MTRAEIAAAVETIGRLVARAIRERVTPAEAFRREVDDLQALVERDLPARARALAAADRLRLAFADADAGGYGRNGWYSYISRGDIEAVLDAVDGRST